MQLPGTAHFVAAPGSPTGTGELHCWDPGTPIEETLRTLNDLVRCGKVHYIGVSNFTGWQLQKTIMLSEFMGLNRIVSLQQEYSLLCRATEWECVEVCRNEGIGLIPWGPLKGGWLTGKIRRSKAPPDGSRVSFAESHPGIYYRGMSHPNYSDFANERVWNLLDVMEQIGTMHGKTIAQVGLRWLLQKDFIPSVIVGCKTLKQLEDNIGAGRGWKLTNQQVEELNAASAVEVPLPYGYIENIFSSRKRTSICK
ncbi:1-deoxyxylulose-5-phosphate synthase YajO-like [Saccoglossus kowalevskii]|uniref:Versiconal hemiacetal acetate reductase-like n=1 Tax=Saccoglossus kowalevskii TaxID=10224 RepID=A0ABM0M690_SACKO|nr:PREDICTED: versiconal hemiacetal acetate reductase-like [Saccoglossus kowalevskii]